MADFIATESGNSASGYLIANGQVYPAVSGSAGLRDIPQGSYTHGDATPVRADQPTMTDGTGRAKFREFHVIGTGPQGSLPESRSFTTHDHGKTTPHPNGGYRTGVELHYDGGSPGTAGCIGYQDPAAKDALIADPDKSVNVQYMADDAAVKAEVERRLGHSVDWSKVAPPRKPGSGGSGTHTKTKKGKHVRRASHTVLVGPKARQLAHKTAALDGGDVVAEGNATVLVEPGRYPVARVDHMTTDGSPLADGEDSVLLT
ncbi:MAG TPA: hypothetical protein VGM56_01795 [Byssovorax sp.]|jgi:uncharacterized Zn-binding protein involved in type VI secretion